MCKALLHSNPPIFVNSQVGDVHRSQFMVESKHKEGV